MVSQPVASARPRTGSGEEIVRVRRLGLLALISGAAAVAQTGPPPVALESGREVAGSAATPGEAGLVGCYAIATRPGEDLAITLRPTGFDGEVRVARGALCNANAVQARRAWTGAQPVELSLPAAGGRYLILVMRPAGAGGGRFVLTARRNGAEVAAGSETMAPPIETAASAPPPPPSGVPLSARRQLMLAQVEQRNAQLAEQAEDRRRQQEAQARAEEEARIANERQAAEIAAMQANQPDVGALIVGGFRQGFNDGIRQANEAARIDQAHNQRIRDMEAEYRARQDAERARVAEAQARTAEQRRVAQQNMAAAQQRMRAARQQQAAAQTSSSGGTRSAGNRRTPDPPQVEMIAMLEGVVVCPLDEDRAGLFGASACHGPFTSVAGRPNEASTMNQACGNNSNRTARDLGTYGNNRVWGCGYGINPRRSGSPNIDQAAHFGLTIPSRQTFRCPATTSGYCRN
ncbi:MAG TPA: hypothetical protein VMG08_14800 [Allosphingosinicella sp.]|nr:hypothetical protein [Allosphingosinicella sp.]